MLDQTAIAYARQQQHKVQHQVKLFEKYINFVERSNSLQLRIFIFLPDFLFFERKRIYEFSLILIDVVS